MSRLKNGNCLFCWQAPGKSFALFLSIVYPKGWLLVNVEHYPELEAFAFEMRPPNESEAQRFLAVN